MGSTRPFRWWLATALGVAALLLVVTNIVMTRGLHAAQRDLAQHQRMAASGAVYGRVYGQIVHALAMAATQGNDLGARDLLIANGITLGPGGQPVPAPPPPPTALPKP